MIDSHGGKAGAYGHHVLNSLGQAPPRVAVLRYPIYWCHFERCVSACTSRSGLPSTLCQQHLAQLCWGAARNRRCPSVLWKRLWGQCGSSQLDLSTQCLPERRDLYLLDMAVLARQVLRFYVYAFSPTCLGHSTRFDQ
jgi:hypothetical protein